MACWTSFFVGFVILQIVSGLFEPSCQGRCNHHLDKSYSCQCNYACAKYADCCTDYEPVCKHHGTVHTSQPQTTHGTPQSGCTSISAIADKLWNLDPDKLPLTDFTFNLGGHASKSHNTDVSPDKLFTHVNEAPLSRPMWKALKALWDDFNPQRGAADPITAAKKTEIDHFLDIVMASPVMDEAYTYATCNNIFQGDKAAFRAKIYSLWFVPYSRTGQSDKDSSGFEHVFIGEYKNNIVEGFHDWLRFYKEEQAGRLNYSGYLRNLPLPFLEQTFNWNGHYKRIDSFIAGTSPTFNMAVATICILTKPNSQCHFSLNGHRFDIKEYDESHTSGLQVATAYTVFP